MVRIHIRLPDELFARAKKLCAAREISLAELARRGIEYTLSVYAPEADPDWQLPTPRSLGWRGLTDDELKAQALAAYYMEARQTWAFAPEKLRLLLAGLLELLPWLHQWHAAVDPAYGASPAEAIEALLDAECHELGLTRVDLETTRMSESAPAPRERKPRAAKKPKAGEEVLAI